MATTKTSTPKRVAFIHGGSFFHLATLVDPAVVGFDLVEVYAPEMAADSLDSVDAIFLAARTHPDVLEKIAPLIIEFLERPGTKAYIDGENCVGQWLPGTTETHRGTNFWAWRTGEDVGRRSVNPEHPIWEFLTQRSVHWHYHGVLTAPAAATPLVVLEQLPVGANANCQWAGGTDPWGGDYLALGDHPNILLYHDGETFGSELVVSTMDSAYHHGSGFMPGATQLLYRMLRWLSV